MRPLRFGLVTMLPLALLCALTASATTVTFTASCPTCFTSYTTYTDPATGTTFATAIGASNVTGMNYYGSGSYPADFLVEDSAAFQVANTLTITFPTNVSFFDMSIGSFNGGPFTFTASDGANGTFPIQVFGYLESVGLTDPNGVRWVTVNSPANDTWVITRVNYTPVPVPEPGTLGLLAGSGLTLAGVLRRKLSL